MKLNLARNIKHKNCPGDAGWMNWHARQFADKWKAFWPYATEDIKDQLVQAYSYTSFISQDESLTFSGAKLFDFCMELRRRVLPGFEEDSTFAS